MEPLWSPRGAINVMIFLFQKLELKEDSELIVQWFWSNFSSATLPYPSCVVHGGLLQYVVLNFTDFI